MTKKQQRRKPAVRKLEILNAALDVAEHVGYQNVTRDQIGAKLGLSGTAIQYHFHTAPKLRRAMMRHAITTERLAVIRQGIAAADPQTAKLPAELCARALSNTH